MSTYDQLNYVFHLHVPVLYLKIATKPDNF